MLDRRAGALIRRLLLVARDSRRAAALAARRGVALWGDCAERFDLLFIQRDGSSTWLLDETGQRVAWLGGGKTLNMATLELRIAQPVADSTLARLRRQLRAQATDASRRPKPRGRPAGRRDATPGRLIRGHSRRTHERLALQLRDARTELGWRGSRVLREAEMMGNPTARTRFDSETRALLAAIGRYATRIEILRRVERQFLRPQKAIPENSS
jgi:hypothetical protein